MLPGADTMGAPASFTARRPNASNLPSFELPPPPHIPAFPKYNTYQSQHSSTNPVTGTASISIVGNLLTPPSGASSDGLSPQAAQHGASAASVSAAQSMSSYTGNGYSWPQPHAHQAQNQQYSYSHQQQTSMSPSAFSSIRGPFSPSLSSIVKQSSSPNPADSMPQSSHSSDMPTYSAAMTAQNLPSIPTHHPHMMISQAPMSAPLTNGSSMGSHEAYGRLPPTPTYYSGPHSAQPGQTSFGFPAHSPISQTPLSAGGALARMSSAHPHGQIPSLHAQIPPPSYAPQRAFSYAGPAMSNMGAPHHQMHMAGQYGHGMPHMYTPANATVGVPDRPFKCNECPQSFNRNHDLKRHKRIHLAVKPYPCGHCEKSFSRKDALKRHILVKGCDKNRNAVADKLSDGSSSPESQQSGPMGSSPIIAATA